MTAAEGWHPGVVGLVAARLKEKFGRPAFAIALEPGGIGTGSGRSIAGVDIGRAVRRAVAEGLLVKGGGHAMAAGVTLRKGALAQLRGFLEATLGADVETARRVKRPVDRRRGDRGCGQHRSRRHDRSRRAFRIRQSRAGDRAAGAHADLCRGGRSGAYPRAPEIRRRLDPSTPSLSVPQARSSVIALRNSRGRQVHAAGTFAIDRWQGEERVQFKITDIAPAEPFTGR